MSLKERKESTNLKRREVQLLDDTCELGDSEVDTVEEGKQVEKAEPTTIRGEKGKAGKEGDKKLSQSC